MPLGRVALTLLDERLAGSSRQEGALRLRLGQLLEALARPGSGRGSAHAELGFLRLSAYVRERCEVGVRWAQSARAVARHLERLPALRAAVARGEVSWSQAELVSESATPADESDWLVLARRLTVRQLREVARGGGADGGASGERDAAGRARDAAGCERDGGSLADDEQRELRLRVDQEDFWLWQVTRSLFSLRLGTPMATDQGFALLAEAHTTLTAEHPELDLYPDAADWREPGAAAWCKQREAWRVEAEVRCEASLAKAAPPAAGADAAGADAAGADAAGTGADAAGTGAGATGADASGNAGAGGALTEAVIAGLAALDGRTPAELDAAIREISRALAAHDFELGRGLLEIHRSDGWRRLGYASERQYAQERLGISRSVLYARRGLALRLQGLPTLAASLRRGELGVESAVALVRVVTPPTEAAWVARARRRTVKMLREEVEAASVAQRVSGEADCPPPTEAELEGYFALERAVLHGVVRHGTGAPAAASVGETWPVEGLRGDESQGAARDSTARVGDQARGDAQHGDAQHGDATAVRMSAPPAIAGPYRTMLASLGAWLATGLEGATAPLRRGAALRGAGRVEVRLRLSSSDYEYWHQLERAWRRAPHGPMAFLRYACLAVWKAWRHVLTGDHAASAVLARDRGRCSCPVCDAVAESRHHVVFRSQGGSDEDQNLTALCPLCHLDGIHAGRLAVAGAAPDLHWAIGRAPLLRVAGRERVLA